MNRDSLRYNSMSDEDARAAEWLTNENPPRRLLVSGTAAIDPDVFVAKLEDGGDAIHAHPNQRTDNAT